MFKPLLGVAVGGLIGLAAAADPIDLPQLGNPADLALSPAEEAQIGARIVHQLYAEDDIIRDDEVTQYLTDVGWKLAAAGTASPPNFRFYLIRDPRINAFALPGAYIGVNAGTLIATTDESELAAVMAHEEAHVTQRHIARSINDTQTADIATWAAVLAAIIAGSANPDVVMSALALGQGINYNRAISYTRANEMEADRIGIRTLADAGYDPAAMADFFARLEQQTRLYGAGLPEILQTHPVNTTRIAEANERAAAYPRRHYSDSSDYLYMRARTAVLISELPNTAADYFRSKLATDNGVLAAHYGYAMALQQLGRYTQALNALAPVLAAQPRQVHVNLLQAGILMDAGRQNEALSLYAKVVSTYPNYPPAILECAQAQIDAGKGQMARQTLLTHLQALGNTMETYHMLAKAAAAVGNLPETQFQTANYLFEQGDVRGAVEQIDAALRLSSLSADDRARLLARRREIIATLPRGQLPADRDRS
jgi:predicted Zn-dependent protease